MPGRDGGDPIRTPIPTPIPTHTPIHISIHYDFASSLCYVAHRVMERIASRFEANPRDEHPPIAFHWTPIDLAALLNWNRGALVPEDRRANAVRVAQELAVPVRVPNVWLDSRGAMAAALAIDLDLNLDGELAQASWRERVYSAIFEEGRACDEEGELERWARDLGLCFDESALERGRSELERRTRSAAEAMVTGVPTFMLADWPMGGIQDDDTMVSLITRFAKRARERGTA
jgi:predicted DsbA family dithiol-disulfide isomerase